MEIWRSVERRRAGLAARFRVGRERRLRSERLYKLHLAKQLFGLAHGFVPLPSLYRSPQRPRPKRGGRIHAPQCAR